MTVRSTRSGSTGARRPVVGDEAGERRGDPPGRAITPPYRHRPSNPQPVTIHLAGGVRWRCSRSEEHTSELQSLTNLVCRLLLEKKKKKKQKYQTVSITTITPSINFTARNTG